VKLDPEQQDLAKSEAKFGESKTMSYREVVKVEELRKTLGNVTRMR